VIHVTVSAAASNYYIRYRGPGSAFAEHGTSWDPVTSYQSIMFLDRVGGGRIKAS